MGKKKSASSVTIKNRRIYRALTALSWALIVGPLLGYVIYGFIVGGTVEKVSLGIAGMSAIILTAFSVIFKKHIRSTIFIVILGIYLAIQKITVLLIILSVCTILDEFLVTPLQKRYREKTVINAQIDGRIGTDAPKD